MDLVVSYDMAALIEGHVLGVKKKFRFLGDFCPRKISPASVSTTIVAFRARA
jgi:hypothetical protein